MAKDPKDLTPQESVEIQAQKADSVALDRLAAAIVEKTGLAKTANELKQLKEEFVEMKRQNEEAAQKALEGKPGEASAPDAGNRYQPTKAAEFAAQLGYDAAPRGASEELTPYQAMIKGFALTLMNEGDARKGFEAGVKAKGFGAHEALVNKTLGLDDFSAGGALHQPEVSSDVVGALLAETTVIGDPAVTRLPVNGTLDLPYELTAPTGNWAAENAAHNATTVAFDQVTLRTENFALIVPVSEKLLRSVGGAMAAIDRSIRRAAEQQIDAKFIRGDGTANTPQGLRYLAASANLVNVNGTTSAANSETSILTLEQRLTAGNVPWSPATARYMFSPRSWRYLWGLRGAAGDDLIFRQEMLAGRLNGIPIAGASRRGTNQIPENLAVTDTSETEIYLYATEGLRVGYGENMVMDQSNVAAYNDSSGNVVAPWSRGQRAFKLSVDVGMAEVFRGLGIAVLIDVDWGV